jgi:DNA-directed RNA polymerase subunit F
VKVKKMTDLKILEEKSINLSQLREEIKSIKKRDDELGFRTAKVSEQLEVVKIIKEKDAEEIFEKLEKLNVPRLKDVHINKIIDLMPGSMVELRNIITGYALTVTNDNLEKILAVISEYTKKK